MICRSSGMVRDPELRSGGVVRNLELRSGRMVRNLELRSGGGLGILNWRVMEETGEWNVLFFCKQNIIYSG